MSGHVVLASTGQGTVLGQRSAGGANSARLCQTLQPESATMRETSASLAQRFGVMAYLVRTGRLIFRLWCLFAINGKWQGDTVMKRVGVVVAMLVLAGCGGGAGGWGKAGISPPTAGGPFSRRPRHARAPPRRDDAPHRHPHAG